MSATLAQTFAQSVSNGLRRKSIMDCYQWATKCRIMGAPLPGPYNDKYFPWAKEMHNCDAEKWCALKGAQIGITEIVLNRVLYTIDIKRVDCLYLLPSQTPDATTFSAGRFDPALEASTYLNDLFSDVQNVNHKRAGTTNLYIRGTRVRSQLKTVPVGLIVFDELEEMTQKNLSLAEERVSGQISYQIIKISTPTISGRGISLEYNASTQEHFCFRCPSCSRWTELVFPDCLKLTGESLHDPGLANSYYQCKECKAKLEHKLKYEWLRNSKFVPTKPDSPYRGFYISGMYSSAARRAPAKVAQQVLEAKESPEVEQELWNSVIGQPHEVAGARVTDNDLENCRKDHTLADYVINNQNSIVTMGVDPGAYDNYYEVNEWLPLSRDGYINNNVDVNMKFIPRLVAKGFTNNFFDFDLLMRQWRVRACVVDGQPSRREAKDFANRFPKRVVLCYYAEGIKGKTLTEWTNEPCISVDRTSWLDLSLGRFRRHTILLPNDIDETYCKHVKAPVRMPGKDKHGNPTASYVTGDREADHHAHARNYAEIALNFVFKTGLNQTISESRIS